MLCVLLLFTIRIVTKLVEAWNAIELNETKWTNEWLPEKLFTIHKRYTSCHSNTKTHHNTRHLIFESIPMMMMTTSMDSMLLFFFSLRHTHTHTFKLTPIYNFIKSVDNICILMKWNEKGRPLHHRNRIYNYVSFDAFDEYIWMQLFHFQLDQCF